MITFTWTIPQTDYTYADADGSIDKVTTLHWRCTATEGEATATSYGTVGIPEDDEAASPAYHVDEAAAIAAAQRLLGADIESGLAAQLDTLAAPTQGSGRIWDIPAGTKVWRAGEAVVTGDVRVHKGTPYKALRSHTTERGWAPDVTPAVWTINRDMHDGPQPWVQPQGAHDAYGEGAVVTHNGQTWDNTHGAGNSWEPGVHGWTARP